VLVLATASVLLHMQVEAVRADKVKHSTWGGMAEQEQILLPIKPYRPLSAFDANDCKNYMCVDMLTPVTSYSTAKTSKQIERAQAQVTFLRQVEQVWCQLCFPSWKGLARGLSKACLGL
jgi:hypothetical protein